MKVLGIMFVVFLVAVVAVLSYAATKPDVFEVRRAIVVNAAPDKIFPLINDFKSWTAWSPYEKKDPAMQRTYGGATSGTYSYGENGRHLENGDYTYSKTGSNTGVITLSDGSTLELTYSGHNSGSYFIPKSSESGSFTST